MNSLEICTAFAKNLTSILAVNEMTQSELATRLGVSKAQVSDWCAGKNIPRTNYLASMVDVLNCKLSDLLTEGETSGYLPRNFAPLPKMKEWPVLGATACGQPLHRESVDETVLAPEDIKADLVFRCVGDSMINARIFDGDAVFIRRQETVENGEIAVVRMGDEYTLKRVYCGDGYVELRAENPTFAPILLRGNELEDSEVVGLAVTFLSKVR